MKLVKHLVRIVPVEHIIQTKEEQQHVTPNAPRDNAQMLELVLVHVQVPESGQIQELVVLMYILAHADINVQGIAPKQYALLDTMLEAEIAVAQNVVAELILPAQENALVHHVELDIINQIAVQRAVLPLPPQVIIQQVAHARNQLAELEKIQI